MPGARYSFWRGHRSRRSLPRRRPGSLRRLGGFLVAVVSTSLVALGVVHVLSTLSRSERFRVRALSISRASEDVRSRLQHRLQGLVGANLFAIDPARAARAVEQDPWVRRAVVKRWLPGTLQVTVEERRPVAVGAFRGRSVVVDSEGWPIEVPAAELPELLRLKGIAARERSAYARQAADALAAVGSVAREAPWLLEGLSAVDLSVPGAVVLERGDEQPQIWLSRRDAGRNLANYLRVRDDVERRFRSLRHVDLRFRDQIALRPGKDGGTRQ